MHYWKKIKQKLIKLASVKHAFIFYRTVIKQRHNLIKRTLLFLAFTKDFKKYININKNKSFYLPKTKIEPCVYDKTDDTPVDPVYFYQDSWCAGKVFESQPGHHFDIGSKAEMVGIISQFTPTTMIDIRPINLKLKNLFFMKGDILSLPFKNDSLKSISSICVIEHIGLGRYGDKLDSMGSEKAIAEIKRVLANDGDLYISLPVDHKSIVYFNAHRAFTRNHILKLFQHLELVEEKYIYKNEIVDSYDKSRGFGTGLFHFKK